MKPRPLAVVDTNVLVSGLITSDSTSPTARILDGMLRGRFPFLLSMDLLQEYRTVLLRPKIGKLHGLNDEEVDGLLTEITANGSLREPGPVLDQHGPKGDQHLFALLSAQRGSLLVTGDKVLLKDPPVSGSVLSPMDFVVLLEADT